jgi:hypothetical protein
LRGAVVSDTDIDFSEKSEENEVVTLSDEAEDSSSDHGLQAPDDQLLEKRQILEERKEELSQEVKALRKKGPLGPEDYPLLAKLLAVEMALDRLNSDKGKTAAPSGRRRLERRNRVGVAGRQEAVASTATTTTTTTTTSKQDSGGGKFRQAPPRPKAPIPSDTRSRASASQSSGLAASVAPSSAPPPLAASGAPDKVEKGLEGPVRKTFKFKADADFAKNKTTAPSAHPDKNAVRTWIGTLEFELRTANEKSRRGGDPAESLRAAASLGNLERLEIKPEWSQQTQVALQGLLRAIAATVAHVLNDGPTLLVKRSKKESVATPSQSDLVKVERQRIEYKKKMAEHQKRADKASEEGKEKAAAAELKKVQEYKAKERGLPTADKFIAQQLYADGGPTVEYVEVVAPLKAGADAVFAIFGGKRGLGLGEGEDGGVDTMRAMIQRYLDSLLAE